MRRAPRKARFPLAFALTLPRLPLCHPFLGPLLGHCRPIDNYLQHNFIGSRRQMEFNIMEMEKLPKSRVVNLEDAFS